MSPWLKLAKYYAQSPSVPDVPSCGELSQALQHHPNISGAGTVGHAVLKSPRSNVSCSYGSFSTSKLLVFHQPYH